MAVCVSPIRSNIVSTQASHQRARFCDARRPVGRAPVDSQQAFTHLRAMQPANTLTSAFRQTALLRAQAERLQGGPPPLEGFSHRLFMETLDYHKRISAHDSVATLRDGKVASGRVYWRMLVDKLAFHEAMERLLARHKNEQLLAPFHDPVLARSLRLRHDLHALAEQAHVHMPKPAAASDAAHDYVEALDLATRRDARALAAHAWLHYLGDMHGGQLMQPRLAEYHGDDAVTSFSFGASVDTLRKTYGRALDVPLTPYEEQLLRAQAVEVYEHSLKMHDAWSNR